MSSKNIVKREKTLNLKKYSKAGLLILIFIISSFGLLILSPIMENSIGQYFDSVVYNESIENINKIRKTDIKIRVINNEGNPIPNLNVDINQTNHEFLFGAMFFHYDPEEKPDFSKIYANAWSKVFNYALLPFYYTSWQNETYYPEESRINKTIEFCHQNNIKMKGHVLVWNFEAGIPNFLNIEEMTKEEIANHFKYRIYNLTQKYRNNITYWDVTNEFVNRGAIDGLNMIDFMHDCYVWAKDAVPTNTYIINDYSMMGHEFGYGDNARVYEKLNAMGTPYDVIGMQTHAMDTDWIPNYEVKATLEGFSRLNKPIHITEFMVTSRSVPITNSWRKGLWNEENQAAYIRQLYTTAFGNPSCDSIAYWGFEDRSNPNKNEGYGIVNSDITPKIAYNTLDQMINQEWHSQYDGLITNSTGWINFNGFYGEYNITIGSKIYNINVEKNIEGIDNNHEYIIEI